MPDAGEQYTDRAHKIIINRLNRIYREAQDDIIKKLNAHSKRMYALDEKKRGELEAGKITNSEYRSWLMGQMFTQKQWQDKLTSVAETLLHVNEQANAIVEDQKRAVFGENATYQAYKLEQDAGVNLSFDIYDSATVTRLLKKQPELLPRKIVNGVKDKAWNRKNIANAVAQGIIQGEGIPDIAKRIARDTASLNNKAMVRYARTAVTGAQNAGRMEALHDAKAMGIRVKKRWLATLDSRTRDAHAELDGQVQDVDKPFDSELGPIMYPGDPKADPGNVWNCRCTLTYEYEDYPSQGIRYDEKNEYSGDMNYNEWKMTKISDAMKLQSVFWEYIIQGKPGEGTIIEPKNNTSQDKKHERDVAQEIIKKFGGNVEIIDQTGRIKKNDYIWNSREWELKSTSNIKRVDDCTKAAISKVNLIGGEIIIDFCGDDIYKAYDLIRHRVQRSSIKEVDVIVMHKGEVFQVLRYK